MAAFFQFVLAKFVALAKYIGDVAVAVFKALWDLLKDSACWVLDQALSLAVSTVQAFDVTPISSQLAAFGQIPANVLEVCAALGLGTAFSIIGAAILIRFALQLIPFVRLGS